MVGTLADVGSLGVTPASLLMGLAVLFVMYTTFRPKRRDPLASQPFRTSMVQQRALERDMQSVVVELNEMTREMSAHLETRSTKLELLMREADAKLAELRAATTTAASLESSLSQGRPRVEDDTDHSFMSKDVVTAPRPSMRLVSDESDHTQERWAEIYRLGDEGLSLTEIARLLNRPNGEIELILALRPKDSGNRRALPERAAAAQG